MHLFPPESLRPRHGHHSTTAYAGPTDAPSPAKTPDFSHPLTGANRSSAIALGVMLVLILAALGWYCGVKLKRKKARDAEETLSTQTRDRIGRGSSVGGENSPFRMDKLFFAGTPSRTNSGGSTLVEGNLARGCIGRRDFEGEEHRSWPRTSHQEHFRRPTESRQTPRCALQAPGDHRRSISPTGSLSPGAHTPPVRHQSLCLTSQRRALYDRRCSSVHSTETYVPTRSASLSHTQHDRRWWNETAARGGSTARANSRLSSLAPIFEHEVALRTRVPDELDACERGGCDGVHFPVAVRPSCDRR